MTFSGAAAQAQPTINESPELVARPSRQQLLAVVWFVGLSLAIAVAAVAAGTGPALVPFILAIGPTVIALALAWREGHGALRRLLRSLKIRPADRRWYLVLAIPVLWSLGTVIVAVATGEP